MSHPQTDRRAVFSGSAIHWVDPNVSWRKTAEALVDGGTVALVSYFGLEEPRSGGDQRALRAAMARVAPGVAADWPTYRDLGGTLGGAVERRGNVSDAWDGATRSAHLSVLGSFRPAGPGSKTFSPSIGIR